jgi:AraC-like DNA-binding protein
MKPNRQKVLRELAGFDVLADVLGNLGLRSRLFCRSELAAPWTMAFAGGNLAHFHIIERGSAWLALGGARSPVALAPGDVVVVGRGQDYAVRDTANDNGVEPIVFPPPDPFGRCTLIRHGHGGATTVMICGSFSFEEPETHPVLALLPAVMHLRAGAPNTVAWFEPMARFLVAEAATMRPGSQTVVTRLTDILFVQVLRAWLAEQPDAPSWLRGLGDPRIGPALALIHERPGEPWTVEKLATQAGLSRSPFTVRFTRVVGEPPQAYITRVRMQRAARLLREQEQSLAHVAQSVGYESESSFSKAFKRQFHKTPGQFRTERRIAQTADEAVTA